MVIAFLLLFALAPQASAAQLGPIGQYSFPEGEGPGEFRYSTGITGAAVNHGGVGGAAPGDLYATDLASGFSPPVPSRIQQFSSAGVLTRIWNANAQDIAIDQGTGDVYASSGSQINVYSATGQFVRRLGYDVVATGPDDGSVNEQVLLTVRADAGTFTICALNLCTDPGAKVSDPISFNAAPAAVEVSINELLEEAAASDARITPGTTVTVNGGVGSADGLSPYTITFSGSGAGDDVANIYTTATNLALAGGKPRATMRTLQEGGSPETCVPATGDSCKGGSQRTDGGALQGAGALALAPSAAPNGGNVLVAERFERGRINEFTGSGAFVRAFGWDVVANGPGDGTSSEQQKVTLGANTTGGGFSLGFGGALTGAEGVGNLNTGSNVITRIFSTEGTFAVGQVVSGEGIPSGTTITSVGPTSLTMSANAMSGGGGAGTETSLIANDMPFNAAAAQVEAALNSLSTVGGSGGSVSVSGPSGGPYIVTFGSALGGDNLPLLVSSVTGLSVSSATPSVQVETVQNGGSFETCVQAVGDTCKSAVEGAGGRNGSKLGQFRALNGGIAVDSTGSIYVTDFLGFNNVNTNANFRIQKFTPSGSGLIPSLFGSSETQQLTVNASAGSFRLSYGAEHNAVLGTGTFSKGSRVITDVTVTKGHFEVGQQLREAGYYAYVMPFEKDAFVTAIGPDTLTMSEPAPNSKDSSESEISSDLPYATPDLSFNAPASGPGSIQSALNALPSISGAGGSVSVTGPDGGPYLVKFDGGNLATTDPATLKVLGGSVPLSGGGGPGANEAEVVTLTTGGPNGVNALDGPIDVAIDDADDVFVSRSYPSASATCPEGAPSTAEVRIQTLDPSGAVQGTSVPCIGIRSPQVGEGSGFGGKASNLTVDPVAGVPYVSHYGLTALGGSTNVFVFGDIGEAPELVLDPPADVGDDRVTVSGTINPHGPLGAGQYPISAGTTYRLQYRKAGDLDWIDFAPETSIGTSNSPQPFSVGVSGLAAGTPYEFRVIVSKPGFPVVIHTQSATTVPGLPRITKVLTSDVTADSATLHAAISSQGSQTSYRFEYGPTLDYGRSTPESDAGASLSPVDVQAQIDSLEPVTYHFRVVATNAVGTVRSPDQTFNFYPDNCPNALVRQQTGSGRLPDCRAYEIASPGDTGSGVLILAGGPNSPDAVGPSRVAFVGALGTIVGSGGNPPDGGTYVSTRGATGWTTRYVGFPSNGMPNFGGSPTRDGGMIPDASMGRILIWDRGQSGRPCCGLTGSMAPYVYDANGTILDRWPTGAAQIPGGTEDISCGTTYKPVGCGPPGGFVGDAIPSKDFSHYFFSSVNVPFAPGGLTGGIGSAYDNDTATGGITIASKRPDGTDIPREPAVTTDDYLKLPFASEDGSHIMMAASGTGVSGKSANQPLPFLCGWTSESPVGLGPIQCPSLLPSHLYMRVDGAVTYDVSRGHVVTPEGMTADGGTVYFTTAEDLTEDGSDTDSSTDLYAWTEESDQVARVSQGNGAGNTDSCKAPWTAGCAIEVVGSSPNGPIDSEDDPIAADSGDIYFYSPEQFVAGKGIPGRRNLYVTRNDDVRYVATLDSDKPLSRLQVTPDGQHAAFVTASPLTGFDNSSPDGVCSRNLFGDPETGPLCAEMFEYDAESGAVRCVSCHPGGSRPHSDVSASQNGRFITDDGRTFFSTLDALQDVDTNRLRDVYEFVDSRPQLITSGLGAERFGSDNESGLVSVSGNGLDVYFATTEILVAQDHNGAVSKIYNARTGGGFPLPPVVAPCAAADECHGATSATPPPAGIASTAGLGAGGNVKPSAKKRKKHRKKRGKRGKRHKHSTARNPSGKQKGGRVR